MALAVVKAFSLEHVRRLTPLEEWAPARGEGRNGKGQEGKAGGAKDLRPLDRGPSATGTAGSCAIACPTSGSSRPSRPAGHRAVCVSATVPTLRCRMT